MTKNLSEAIKLILESKPAQAEDILFEHTSKIVARKLIEMKKMYAYERFGLISEEVSGNDIYAHGDHIGHIEHGEHNGKPHYRIVSYTETQPPEEHHKSLANAQRGAHKFIQAHVAKHDYETGVHEQAIEESSGLRLVHTYKNGPDSAKIHKDYHNNEYRVSFHSNGVHHKDADYHTDDLEDAHGTAQHQLHALSQIGESALDEDTHGVLHGQYRVSRPDRSGHSVYHVHSGGETYIGATETMSHRDPAHPEHQVYAHHSSGITKHATHERAVQHIIDKHKELGEGVNETKESDIAYENGNHWVYKHPKGHFEVYKNGATHATRVAIIGYKGQEGLDKAKQEADKREVSVKESLDESHKHGNVTKQGRTKLVRVRVRNGQVQRRKRLSNTKGFIMRGGHLSRMSATERRHRKIGARKAKIKRRSKRAQIHRKLVRSLRKRHAMGI